MHDLSQTSQQLESRLHNISAERVHYRNHAEAGDEMGDVQAKQVLVLRQQLDMAFQMNQNLESRLTETENRVEKATAQSMRDASKAYRSNRSGGAAADAEEDSAFGQTGDEEEIAELQRQLRQLRHRFERTRVQRDNWRERSLVYEKACAQLQASLQTLQDQSRLTLPSGVKQSLDSIWNQAKSLESPEPPTAADARLAAAVAKSKELEASWGSNGAVAQDRAWSAMPSRGSDRVWSGIPSGKKGGRVWRANPGMSRTNHRPSTAPASRQVPTAKLSAHQAAKLVVYEEGEEEGEEDEAVEYVELEGSDEVGEGGGAGQGVAERVAGDVYEEVADPGMDGNFSQPWSTPVAAVGWALAESDRERQRVTSAKAYYPKREILIADARVGDPRVGPTQPDTSASMSALPLSRLYPNQDGAWREQWAPSPALSASPSRPHSALNTSSVGRSSLRYSASEAPRRQVAGVSPSASHVAAVQAEQASCTRSPYSASQSRSSSTPPQTSSRPNSTERPPINGSPSFQLSKPGCVRGD
eukprot:gene13658-19545_t